MISRKLPTRRRRSPHTCSKRRMPTSSSRTGRSSCGHPSRSKTIQDVAFAAYTNLPDGMEYGLEGVALLRPAEPDVPVRQLHRASSRSTARPAVEGAADGRARRLRRAHQPDDRRGPDPRRPDGGLRHRGDAVDHVRRRRQLHRLQLHGLPLPTAVGDAEVRVLETVTPSPHHPFGAKGVGESATVGSPAAYVNAVVDALAHPGFATSRCPSRPRRCGRRWWRSAWPNDPRRRHRPGGPPRGRRRAVRARDRRPRPPSGVDPSRGSSPGPGRRSHRRLGGRSVRGARGDPRVAARARSRRAAPGADRAGGRRRPGRRRRRRGHDVRVGGHGRGAARAVRRRAAPGRRRREPGRPRAQPACPDGGLACEPRGRRVAGRRRDRGDGARRRGHPPGGPRLGSGLCRARGEHTRAASVFGVLRDRGVDDAALARVRSPAGLDLGPLRQEEIAVAVLAELVAWRHSAAGDAWSAGAVTAAEAVDPVCGMRVPTEPVGEMVVVDGVSYHFCCSGCRARFEADPARYIGGVTAH